MWRCLKCNEFNDEENLDCWNCKSNRKNNEALNSEDKVIEIEERYPALRTISSLYKVLAWIALVLALLVVVINANRLSFPILMGIILGGLIVFITLLATSEGIKVFLDIEENTRTTSLIKMEEYDRG